MGRWPGVRALASQTFIVYDTTRFHLSAVSEYASVSRRADGDDF
jgi:hypothetical protein